MENFIAIGNDELGNLVKKGDKLIKGELSGTLQYGTNADGKETNIMGFVTVGETAYLAAIKDQLVFGWEKAND